MNELDRAARAAVRAAEPYATAVTVAVLHQGREQVRCSGHLGHERSAPCTPDTVFELGSVSKTFTALLLAGMAAGGELALADPVQSHLPPDWRPATARSTEPIRLLHLATHTSGLPRLPPGLLASAVPNWAGNPYAAFGDDRLRTALARTTVRFRPGTRYRYSNYGVGLLGRALAETGGLPYGQLLAERVCRPLELTATGCSPDAPDRAIGYRRGRALPPWSIPGLPGAGAVRSSGADLLRFLRAHLDGPRPGCGGSALKEALDEVQRARLRRPHSSDELCLVWNRRHSGGRDLYFHTGGTRGFTAFVGFSPESATAVAALANTGPTLDGRFVQAGYELLRTVARGG
ncbi:penicillin-binding protein [Kitasatospora xanthocidica]|uniref:serine hydrolase domain-containing protein n=1 Tax=Kitasatospora xanthocidica TaxID=83382 RepID=UPI0016768CD5|nr:serine hydrolase domain-containing protein [Kitasatospora xanthocidica]GHF33693.1 penicillin-binding protein [Kitasatospora xanthocidica]